MCDIYHHEVHTLTIIINSLHFQAIEYQCGCRFYIWRGSECPNHPGAKIKSYCAIMQLVGHQTWSFSCTASMVELSIVQDDIILIVVKHVHNCNVEAVTHSDCFVYFVLRLEHNISVEIYFTYPLILVLIIHGPDQYH